LILLFILILNNTEISRDILSSFALFFNRDSQMDFHYIFNEIGQRKSPILQENGLFIMLRLLLHDKIKRGIPDLYAPNRINTFNYN